MSVQFSSLVPVDRSTVEQAAGNAIRRIEKEREDILEGKVRKLMGRRLFPYKTREAARKAVIERERPVVEHRWHENDDLLLAYQLYHSVQVCDDRQLYLTPEHAAFVRHNLQTVRGD